MGIDNSAYCAIIHRMKKLLNKRFEEFVKETAKKSDEIYAGKTSEGIDCLLITKKRNHTINAYAVEADEVALVGNLVFGFEDDFDSIYLSSIDVAEDYRNLGIGSFMVDYFIQMAKESEYKNIKIESFQNLVSYFKKFGFKKCESNSRIVSLEKSLTNKKEKTL